MKDILILNIDENIIKANNIINTLNKNNLSTLYLNNNIFNNSLKYKLLDDFFKSQYASKIDKVVRNIAKTWYKSVEKELFYFNISLPELLQNEFLKTWPIFLKIEILTEIIKKQKPNNIYIITEYDEDIRIIKEIIKNKNINLNYKFIKKSKNISLKQNFKDFIYSKIAKLQNFLLKFYLYKNKRKNNILVLGNLRLTAPFLKKLKTYSNNVMIRGGENLGRGLFTPYCDYYLTFKEFSNKQIEDIIKKEKIKLIKKWNLIKNNKKLKNKLKYKINLFNILEPTLKKFFLEDFIKLMKYIEITKYIGNKIDIIVTHNDVIKFEKTIIKSANNLNVPTLTMIEGFLPIKQIKQGTQFIPFSAKIMAVHSEAQKKAIIKKGINENRLIITGYPDFDKYFNDKFLPKKLIYKRYKIPLDKKIILYIGERYTKNKYESSIWAAFTQEQYKNVYREIFSALRNFPELFLIIKKHPSGSLDERIIKRLAKQVEFNNFIITSDLDVHNILNASYAIINRLSTMALEAMFLRKPVIVMDTYFDSNDNFGYTQFNAALHVKKADELKKTFKNLLEDTDLKEELQKNMEKFVNHNYINDGNASLRMKELIEKIIKNKFNLLDISF